MKRDERGYIVVETLLSFLLFVLLMISILSIINLVVVQARVHYAITQTAETLSMYCYVLDVTGAAEHIQNSSEKAETVQVQSDEFKENLSNLLSDLENLSINEIGDHGKTAATQVQGWVEDVSSDPKASLQLLLNYGLQQGSSAVMEQLVRPLVGRYLSNSSMSGKEYLEKFHVENGLEGLDFYTFSLLDANATGADDSTLLTSDGDVKIVVQYYIDYTFGILPLPLTLHITQEVMTKAWLGGNGDGYSS